MNSVAIASSFARFTAPAGFTPQPAPKTDEPRPRCRHCGFNVQCRPRGLCWPCFYSPARELYGPGSANPGTAKYARRGVGHVGGLLPDMPTTAAPGTPEKLAVLESRAAAGLAIFHPADARWPGDPVTLDFLAMLAHSTAAM